MEKCNNYKELDLLIHTYFIPIIADLKQSKRNIEELEKMIVDLNAKSLKIKFIPQIKIGGNLTNEPNVTNTTNEMQIVKNPNIITEEEKKELIDAVAATMMLQEYLAR